jgi:hypothetical protein
MIGRKELRFFLINIRILAKSYKYHVLDNIMLITRVPLKLNIMTSWNFHLLSGPELKDFEIKYNII